RDWSSDVCSSDLLKNDQSVGWRSYQGVETFAPTFSTGLSTDSVEKPRQPSEHGVSGYICLFGRMVWKTSGILAPPSGKEFYDVRRSAKSAVSATSRAGSQRCSTQPGYCSETGHVEYIFMTSGSLPAECDGTSVSQSGRACRSIGSICRPSGCIGGSGIRVY